LSLVKARSRFNAVDACHSSNAAGQVPPSPLAPGRTLPSPLSKRFNWIHVPCCCSTSIEYLRLLLAIEDSALRQLTLTTMASADFSAPLRRRCRRRSLAPQTDAETSQGKSCLFPPAPAEFTRTAFRMTIGHPHPVLGYPAARAFYPVSVRRVRVLPYASFRFRLTADTLAWASGSGHHGPQRTFTP